LIFIVMVETWLFKMSDSLRDIRRFSSLVPNRVW